MQLPFETLTSIIRACTAILLGLMDLVISLTTFLSLTTLIRLLTFLSESLPVIPAVLLSDLFLAFYPIFFNSSLYSVREFWSCWCLSFHWFAFASNGNISDIISSDIIPRHHRSYPDSTGFRMLKWQNNKDVKT